MLVERVIGRRLDPVTGKIYHLKFSPPPAELVPRLTIRSDDTEEKARNRLRVHAHNVDAVRGMYEGSPAGAPLAGAPRSWRAPPAAWCRPPAAMRRARRSLRRCGAGARRGAPRGCGGWCTLAA